MRKTITSVTIALLMLAGSPFSIHLNAANEKSVTTVRIIPEPLKMTQGKGTFILNTNTRFYVKGEGAKTVALFFASKIKYSTGYDLQFAEKPGKGIISLVIGKTKLGNEGYTLHVSDQVKAEAQTPQGLFYAMQSFMQLLPPQIESKTIQNGIKWEAQAVNITDKPRFDYRGIMLDVCRHFMPAEDVKRQIDVLSLFKINNLHWHLTEDQAWRVEIKKYPKLTEIGAWRTEGDGSRYGGFYTQEEIKDVVAYAKERFVNIVPELEIPGHELAAIAAYPWLSCREEQITPRIIWGVEDIVMCPGKESSFQFLQDVINELVPLFPGSQFHIGGDESPRDEWSKCPLCQQRIKDLGYKDEKGSSKEAQLQSYVVSRVEKMLNAHGKSIIGWDEILEGGNLNKSATIMSWRGEHGGIDAAKADHHVIMTPSSHGMYIDQFQGDPKVEPVAIGGYTTLARTYGYDPTPAALVKEKKEHYILGVQCNLWSEYMYTVDIMEYRLYPRALALAEIGWTQLNRKNFNAFAQRVDEDAAVRLQEHKINFHIPLPEQPNGSCNYVAFTDQTSVTLKTTRPEKIVYTLDGTTPTVNSNVYTEPLKFTESATIQTATVLPCGIMSPIRVIRVVKESLSPAVQKTDVTPGLNLRVAYGTFMHTADFAYVKNWKTKTIERINEIRTQTSVPGNVRNVKDYAAVAEGFIKIPEDGVYYFSSNNAEVWIDGVKIVDNDRDPVKKASRNDGSRALKKGLHAIKVVFLGHINGGYPTYWDDGHVLYRSSTDSKFKVVTPDMLFK